MTDRKLKGSLAGAVAVCLVALSGCGASNTGGSGSSSSQENAAATPDQKWADCTPAEDSKDVTGTKADEDKEIKVGIFPGWDESMLSAQLLKNVLSKDGYKVTIQQVDPGAGYTALSKGDLDVITDVNLPDTHASYVARFENQMTPAGCWYDQEKNTIAVNKDSPAKTIDDLAKMSDKYQNTMYGIEPGAGLTEAVKTKVIPQYGLEKMTFKTSSTPAMLAQLKKATSSKQNVAVTLWHPHRAYKDYPVRDLEDPKNTLGGNQYLYSFVHKGFEKDNPKVTQLLKNFAMSDEEFGDLASLMYNEDEYDGKNLEKAVAEWLSKNPDFAKDWQAGKLGS